jgi:1-acyl-sn-glycerol-3-phosphate acyltransferase
VSTAILNEQSVLDALRKVKYPGFSRDIVSFGFVKDLAIGGFLTALKSGVPIVPVGVSGARAVLGAQGMIVRRGPVRVRTGRPIPTAELGVRDRADLMVRVRREIVLLRG